MLPVRYDRIAIRLCLCIGLWVVASAAAQDQPVAPVTTAPAEREPLFARVIEVHGDVRWAPLDSREYQLCKLDDEYPEGTKVLTGVRSSIKLQVGREEPFTALVIESVGLTVLSEAHKTADTKRVRVGVGYGTIRAGVAEGGLKSDFTVDSPVATLSKRGTWNFGLSYERGTGRFEVFLVDYGLVDALNKLTGERRRLLPNEVVTQTMRRWLDEAQVRHNVAIADLLGQENVEVVFNQIQQGGLGVLGPGEGKANLVNLTNAYAARRFERFLRGRIPAPILRQLAPLAGIVRPEGAFGTGRGDDLIDVLIKSDDELVKRGFARAGRYMIRRSAAEAWLQNRR